MSKAIAKEPREDFLVHKFYTYSGPNYYIDRQAMVFNLYLNEDGPGASFYKEKVTAKFPELAADYPENVVDVFASVLGLVFKMDMDLFVRRVSVSEDDDEWVIALEYLDEKVAKSAIQFVREWFLSMTAGDDAFNFEERYAEVQDTFNKTIYGGPTIYSLIEGGIKRKINVHYLFEENQFQWGYGKKQVRGRSTIFHIDGIKDVEFTTYKDMCGDFLEMCGFPVPKSITCFDLDTALAGAEEIGFPVVVKPVSGHKGQGVTTGIESMPEVEKAYTNITKAAKEAGVAFDGALVQQQIYGYDHRILTVGGKCVAVLKRVPAYVVGDGKSTIEELIRIENDLEVRLDNARSPLCKIKIDEDMTDYLKLQGLSVKTVPEAGKEIVLRRVANISAGGVSINVTKDIHPANIDMVENISKFLNLTVLGVDVLAADISKPWMEGNFGIIEINAGPGVFMHLAPALGGSVDVPGHIMEYLFGKVEGYDRIPIIAGNNLTNSFISKIYNKLKEYKQNVEFGCVAKDGVYFNGKLFTNHKYHDTNCQILLRNPKLDFAVFNHTANEIHDFGIWHQGMDVAILDHANFAESIMKRDLVQGGLLIEIVDVEIGTVKPVSAVEEDATSSEAEELIGIETGNDAISKIILELRKEVSDLKKQLKSEQKPSIPQFKTELILSRDGQELQRIEILDYDKKDEVVFNVLKPFLKEILFKYDYYSSLEDKVENLNVGKRYVN